MEAFYGGAARGGKTDALLMAAAQYLSVPGYSALILRRTHTEAMLADAVMARAREWWLPTGAHWTGSTATWHFPTAGQDSTIQFGYLDHDDHKYRYQSAKFQFIAFDELSHFRESMYRFLFSRLTRSAGVDVPLRMRAASNPGGIGHEWVRSRFIPEGEIDWDKIYVRDVKLDVDHADLKNMVVQRVFLPAKLQDNPSEDQAAYMMSASQLDPVTRAQMLYGDWSAFGGGRFQQAWFQKTFIDRGDSYTVDGDLIYYHEVWRFITVDPAASVPETASDDPDYTVISTWTVTPRNKLLWQDCLRLRIEVPDIVPALQQVYDRWKPKFAAIEGGGMQSGVYQHANRTRMIVKDWSHGNRDKLDNAYSAIVLAESGRLYMPASNPPWRQEVEAELVRFTGDEKRDSHDDVVTTFSMAADILSQKDPKQRKSGEPQRPFAAGGPPPRRVQY